MVAYPPPGLLNVRSSHMRDGAPALAITAGLSIAAVGVVVAAAAGAPYLGFDGVGAGIVLFAAGLFAALFAVPFALERGLRDSELQIDRRWELALIRWGLVTTAVVAVGVALAAIFGLHGSTFGGALAIVVLADSLLIVATLIVWMVSN